MRVGIFITCRLKSARLPGKALEMIGDKRLIDWLITRCQRVRGVDNIVMMTSTEKEDIPLRRVAAEHGISWFSGDPIDVLVRMRDCAKMFNIDLIISVTGDDPFKSIKLMQTAIQYYNHNFYPIRHCQYDFFEYKNRPLGTECYAITRELLERACQEKTETDTEIWGHIVRKFARCPDWLKTEKDYSHYRVTVDEPADLDAMRELIKYLPAEFDVPEICKVLDAHPEIIALNAGVHQREAGE